MEPKLNTHEGRNLLPLACKYKGGLSIFLTGQKQRSVLG